MKQPPAFLTPAVPAAPARAAAVQSAPVPADDLVARALAILAQEDDAWQARRPLDPPPPGAKK